MNGILCKQMPGRDADEINARALAKQPPRSSETPRNNFAATGVNLQPSTSLTRETALRTRRLHLLILAACSLLLLPFAQAQQPLVLRLTLHDTIQPVTAAYI